VQAWRSRQALEVACVACCFGCRRFCLLLFLLGGKLAQSACALALYSKLLWCLCTSSFSRRPPHGSLSKLWDFPLSSSRYTTVTRRYLIRQPTYGGHVFSHGCSRGPKSRGGTTVAGAHHVTAICATKDALVGPTLFWLQDTGEDTRMETARLLGCVRCW